MIVFRKAVFLPLILAFFMTASALTQETYLLNYDNVDIRKVTQDIARFSKKTIILDPRVKGKVTIFSDTLLDEDQVWQVFLRTTQVNGFSTINEGNMVRIVPENEATRDDNTSSQSGDFITKIFLLENPDIAEEIELRLRTALGLDRANQEELEEADDLVSEMVGEEATG